MYGVSDFEKNSIILKTNISLCLKRKVLNQYAFPAFTYGVKT